MQHQVVRVLRLPDDVEPGLDEQAGDPLPEEHGVVGEDDPKRGSLGRGGRLGGRAAVGAQRRELGLEVRREQLEDPFRPG